MAHLLDLVQGQVPDPFYIRGARLLLPPLPPPRAGRTDELAVHCTAGSALTLVVKPRSNHILGPPPRAIDMGRQ